jgi:acyl-coenzyme A synthetase/AMP-(fatty) acid ligase
VDIFTTLSHGGCICIPSEDDRRNDIISSIEKMQVNWALLTPSFAGLIQPYQVPSLRTLSLGGEAVTKDLTTRWTGKVLLINCYGQAECGACLTLRVDAESDRAASNVGYSLPNSICWLVHPDDHDKLAPIGAAGELLVEGPNLARGYFNDEERTTRSFIENPKWAREAGNCRKFYKTGDLLRYNIDGSMDFIGRKDTQIKLRGQRVELGEVEHHISTMPDVAVSMVASPIAGCYANELVAIIQLLGPQSHTVHHKPLAPVSDPSLCLEDIRMHVVPTSCIAIQAMPFTTSLKVNRKLVEMWLEEMETRLDEGKEILCQLDERNLNTHESVALTINFQVAEIIASKDQKHRMKIEGGDFALQTLGIDSIQDHLVINVLAEDFWRQSPFTSIVASKDNCEVLGKIY